MRYHAIHIPKTGGVSLFFSVFYGLFSDSDILSNWNDYGLLNRLYHYIWQQKLEIPYIRHIFNIKDFKLIFAHIPYGSHTWHNDNYQYITLLRNPKEHIKSWLTTLWEINHQCRLLPHEVVDSNITSLDNYQTRYLLEDGCKIEKITSEHLKRAKENLEQCWCGLTEFEELLHNKICEHFKIQRPIQHLNKTSEKNLEFQLNISDKTMDSLLNKNFADLELYEYVKNCGSIIWSS